jgi:hypothetical protein
MAAQATNASQAKVDLYDLVSCYVETPKPHLEIGFRQTEEAGVSLQDQVLAHAASMPRDTHELVKSVFEKHSLPIMSGVISTMNKAINDQLRDLSKRYAGLEAQIDTESCQRVINSKTTVAMNRVLGDAQGRLSPAGIETLLAQHATSMTEAGRKALALALSLAKPLPPKENKSSAPDPKDDRKDSAAVESNVAVLPLGGAQTERRELIYRSKVLAGVMEFTQPPTIGLTFFEIDLQVDRVKELLARVEKVEPKMVDFVKAAIVRFEKETPGPSYRNSASQAVEAAKRQIATKYRDIAIEVEEDSFERYVAVQVRRYSNEFIYNNGESALGPQGFQVDMITEILSHVAGKMKQEGSQDPYCAWTKQQFTEVLQKILA